MPDTSFALPSYCHECKPVAKMDKEGVSINGMKPGSAIALPMPARRSTRRRLLCYDEDTATFQKDAATKTSIIKSEDASSAS